MSYRVTLDGYQLMLEPEKKGKVTISIVGRDGALVLDPITLDDKPAKKVVHSMQGSVPGLSEDFLLVS